MTALAAIHLRHVSPAQPTDAAQADSAAQAKNQRRVQVATNFGHLMTHLYMLVFPSLVTPLREELGLGLGEAVELAFFGYLVYGLGALPAGLITDRWRARWMLAICLSIAGLGAVLAGMSGTPAALTLSLGLVGLGASIYHPTGMALISRTFSKRRGRALGINGVFGNIGLAGAPFITGMLTASFGWRAAYWILGVPGVVGGLLVAITPIDETPTAEAREEARSAQPDGVWPYFLLLCVAMTLGGLAYRGSSLVMPSYFELKATFLTPLASRTVELLGGSGAKTAAATTLTSLVYLMGVVGQLIGGRIADRYDLRLGYLFFHAATLPALVVMVVATEVPLLLAAMTYVLFSLGMQPIENSLVAKLTPASWRSTAYGLKFILTFGVGSLAVVLVGRLPSTDSLPWVFVVVACLELALVAAAATLWLSSRRVLLRVANA